MATKKYYMLDRAKEITLEDLIEIMATGAFWSDELLVGISDKAKNCLKEVTVPDVELVMKKFWPPESTVG